MEGIDVSAMLIHAVVGGATGLVLGGCMDYLWSNGLSSGISTIEGDIGVNWSPKVLATLGQFVTTSAATALSAKYMTNMSFMRGADPAGGIAFTAGLLFSQSSFLQNIQYLSGILQQRLSACFNSSAQQSGTASGVNTVNGAGKIQIGSAGAMQNKIVNDSIGVY